KHSGSDDIQTRHKVSVGPRRPLSVFDAFRLGHFPDTFAFRVRRAAHVLHFGPCRVAYARKFGALTFMHDVFHENRGTVAHTCAQPWRATPATFRRPIVWRRQFMSIVWQYENLMSR